MRKVVRLYIELQLYRLLDNEVGDVCLVCQGPTLAVYGLARGSSHFAWKFNRTRANSVDVRTLGSSSSCNIFFDIHK